MAGVRSRRGTQMEERLPWLRPWLDEVEDGRRARQARYQPTVGDKVGWLCEMYADARPVGEKEKVEVRAELLPEGVDQATFNPGVFLKDIRNNWLEGHVATRLTEAQMAQMEERLPWLRPWLDGVLQKRQARTERK